MNALSTVNANTFYFLNNIAVDISYGLTYYYTFDISTNNTNVNYLKNLATQVYDLSLVGTLVTSLPSPKYGSSSLYLTSNQVQTINPYNFVQTSGVTVSFWAYYNLTPTNAPIMFFLGNTSTNFGIGMNNSQNLYYYVNGVGYSTTNPVNILISTWTNITVSLDSNNILKLYKAGSLADQRSNVSIASASYPVYLGGGAPGSSVSGNTFSGYIDDFRLYNNCLNGKQIQNISKFSGISGYSVPVDPVGLMSYYRFEPADISGDTVSNFASYLYNSTYNNLTNYTPIYDASFTNTAMVSYKKYNTGYGTIDLSNSNYLQIPYIPPLTNNGLSFSFWMRSNNNADSGYYPLFDFANTYVYNNTNNIFGFTIPGLQLWLDAATYSSFSFSSDNYVSSWTDRSGYNISATKYDTGGGFATYDSTGFNGLPGVQITSGQGIYAPIAAGSFSSGMSVFVVWKRNGNTSYPNPFNRTLGNASRPIDMYLGYRIVSPTPTGTSTNDFSVIIIPMIYSMVLSTSTFYEYINGGNDFSFNLVQNSYIDTATAIYIATRADRGTTTTGIWSELIAFNGVLTDTQRKSIEGYLALKWNLQSSLPSGHPYKNTTTFLNIPNIIKIPKDNIKFGLYNNRIISSVQNGNNNMVSFSIVNTPITIITGIATPVPGPGYNFIQNTATITNGTGNYSYINGYYEFSASSFTSTYYPYKAFNNTNTNPSGYAWATSNNNYNSSGNYTGSVNTTTLSGVIYGEWIQIMLPYKIVITSYNIATQTIKAFQVFGSNTGSNDWTNIDSNNNTNYVNTSITYNVTSNPSKYKYIRLITTRTTIDQFVSVYKFGLSGYIYPDVSIPLDTSTFALSFTADNNTVYSGTNSRSGGDNISYSVLNGYIWPSLNTLYIGTHINGIRISADGSKGAFITADTSLCYFFTKSGNTYSPEIGSNIASFPSTNIISTGYNFNLTGLDMSLDGSRIVVSSQAYVSGGTGGNIYYTNWNASTAKYDLSFTQITNISSGDYKGVAISTDKNIIVYGVNATTTVKYSLWNSSGNVYSTPYTLSTTVGPPANFKFTMDGTILYYSLNGNISGSNLYYSVWNGNAFNGFTSVVDSVGANIVPSSSYTTGLDVLSNNTIYVYKNSTGTSGPNIISYSITNNTTLTAGNLYTSPVNDNVWRHYAWTIDPSNQQYTYYVNGNVSSNVSGNSLTFPTAMNMNNSGLVLYYPLQNNGYNYANGQPVDYNIYNIYYSFNITDVSGIYLLNSANNPVVYDAILSDANTISSTNNKYGSGSLSLSSTSSQYVTINAPVTTNSTGASFLFWVRDNSSSSMSSIFDFGSGSYNNKITAGIYADKLFTNVLNGQYNINNLTFGNTSVFYNGIANNPSYAITDDANTIVYADNSTPNVMKFYWTKYNSSSWSSPNNFANINSTSTSFNFNFIIKLTSDGSRGFIGTLGRETYTYANFNDMLCYTFYWTGTTYSSMTPYPDSTPRWWASMDMTPDGSRIVLATTCNNYNNYQASDIFYADWNVTNYGNLITVPTGRTDAWDQIAITRDKMRFVIKLSYGYRIGTWNGTTYNISGDSAFRNRSGIGAASWTPDGGGFFMSIIVFNGNYTSLLYSSGQDLSGVGINTIIGSNPDPIIPVLGNYNINDGMTIKQDGYFYFPSGTSIYRFKINWSNKTTNALIGNSLNDNSWHHVAWTIDSAGTSKYYIDNSLVSTVSGGVVPASVTRTQNSIGTSSDVKMYFNGGIDDFIFLNRLIKETEISNIYNNQKYFILPSIKYIPPVPKNINGYSFSFYFTSSSANQTGIIWSFNNSTNLSTNRVFMGLQGGNIQIGTGSTTYTSIIQPTINISNHYVWSMSISGTSKIYLNGNTTSIITTNTVPYYNSMNFNNSALFSDPTGGNVVAGSISEFRYYDRILTSNDVTQLYGNSVSRTQNTIGASNSLTSYFTGGIDEFQIYNRVLSSNEVSQLSTMGPYYNLQGNAASQVTGLSANSSTSTISYNPSQNYVKGYNISFSPPITGSPFTTNLLSNTYTGFTNSTSYTANVYAVGLYGNSGISQTTFSAISVPSPPTNLAIISATGNSITYSFTLSPGPGITYTTTAIPTSGNTVTQSGNIGNTVTVGGLQSSMQYTINMYASNTIGNSVISANIVYTTISSFPLTNISSASVIAIKYPLNGNISNNYIYYQFTTSGTTSATYTANIANNYTSFDYLVVAGGGGGGLSMGSGGGAGGLLSGNITSITGTRSITITVGGGGLGMGSISSTPVIGSNSIISGPGISLTAIGGGGGSGQSYEYPSGKTPLTGGSGGGQTRWSGNVGLGTNGQGNNGGKFASDSNKYYNAGGGGGAGQVGQDATSSAGGNGGNGIASSITGTIVYYGGGGGGSAEIYGTTYPSSSVGGSGGGGSGDVLVPNAKTNNKSGSNGTDGLGGGGGGGEGVAQTIGYRGGSGVVIIRFLG